MKRSAYAIAILAALAVVTGCGGGSSSGDSSHGRPESAAAALDRLGGRVQQRSSRQGSPARQAEAGEKADNGKPRAQVPQGVPLDTRSARVRKAIADLLHPENKSHGRGESSRSETQKGAKPDRRGGLGILEQLRRAVHERLQQLPGKDRGRSDHDGGPGILEMLR
jgi:hypothetical protein